MVHAQLQNAAGQETEEIRLFLKRLPEPGLFQNWLQERLKASDFTLLLDYYKKDGQSQTKIGEHFWTCQAFCQTNVSYDFLNFDCRPQNCFLAGQALAALHFAGRDIVDDAETVELPNTRYLLDLLAAFPRQFKNTIEIFSKKDFVQMRQGAQKTSKFRGGKKAKEGLIYESPALEQLQSLPYSGLLQNADTLCSRIRKLETQAAKTINHGDYHQGNLLFADNELRAVVDWDFSCIGSAIYDLSYALFMFCLQPPVRGQLADELFCSRKTEAFLDGYTQVNSSFKEMQNLSIYSDFIHLLMLDWVLGELIKGSQFCRHPGFSRLADALAFCCQP